MFRPFHAYPKLIATLSFACLAATASVDAHADDLTVSAAASLTNAFKDIGVAFEASHPGTHIAFNFGASDVLLKQIEQGAPVDVYASADEATMERAMRDHLVAAATRADFAANALVLIVPAGNVSPKSLSDLQGDGYKRIAIGNPDSVPAGRYAKQTLTDAGLWQTLSSKFVQAQNVRQALDYVARGEAEAGFVYATDAAAQASKVAVALTVPTATPVRYPVAAVHDCGQKRVACEFAQYLQSAQPQNILVRYGFRPATP